MYGPPGSATGGVVYVYPPLSVALWPSGLVTRTSTVPAACADVVTVMLVALMLPTVAVAPPMVTVALETKFVPVTVTWFPPATGPPVGSTELTVGGGGMLTVTTTEAVAVAPRLSVAVRVMV